MRILGLDPGLRATGWGIIEAEGNRLVHVANGTVRPAARAPLAERLAELHRALIEMIETHAPVVAAVEETFVNVNGQSTLKLGQARGVVMLTPALMGLVVHEYPTNTIKKTVVGRGHAAKAQVAMMVGVLLGGAMGTSPDAADALAAAICHAHHRNIPANIAGRARGVA